MKKREKFFDIASVVLFLGFGALLAYFSEGQNVFWYAVAGICYVAFFVMISCHQYISKSLSDRMHQAQANYLNTHREKVKLTIENDVLIDLITVEQEREYFKRKLEREGEIDIAYCDLRNKIYDDNQGA